MPVRSVIDGLAARLSRGGGAVAAVHAASAKLGVSSSTFLSNSILQAYLEKSCFLDAHKVFDEMPQRNVVSWSMLVSGYSRSGRVDDMILVFRDMLRSDSDGVRPNAVTFGALLTGCSRISNATAGMQLHCSAIKTGTDSSSFMVSTLIHMYAKCGLTGSSWKAFDCAIVKDVACWTTMISCLVNSKDGVNLDTVVSLLKDMIACRVWPVDMTFCSVLNAFDGDEKLRLGKQVHGCIVKLGVDVDCHLGTALISMYGRCGGVDEAFRLAGSLEHDLVSMTALLTAFAQNGCSAEAFGVLREMIARKMAIDHFVVTSAVTACSSPSLLLTGKAIHCYALRNGIVTDVSCGNAVIAFYGRCGAAKSAERTFHLLAEKDVISWTSLLTSYSQNGCSEEALLLFKEMLRTGVGSPLFCVTGALKACANMADLPTGCQIHSRMLKLGIGCSPSAENALITMYANCGCLEAVLRAFSSATHRSIVTWNALINGLSRHGHHTKALESFHRMQEEGIAPDDYTFVGVLVSCSRIGLITEGRGFFQEMTDKYGLEPKAPHYACMVDLLGRAGMVQEAMQLINTMPFEPDRVIWEALLSSCKLHGNIMLGGIAAERILELASEDPSPVAVLSKVYAAFDLWNGKALLQASADDLGMRKGAGTSWLV